MKHGGADGSHQEISGGTQKNVIFARDIQTMEIHGDYEIHSGSGPAVSSRRLVGLLAHFGIALLGLFLIFARPELPLLERFDPGPVVGGWLLIAGAIVLDAGTRVRAAVSRRRRAVWRSEKNLARAVEALAEGLAFRYDQDERLTRINDPYALDVSWATESEHPEAMGSAAPEPGADSDSDDDSASIADCFASTPTRRLVVLGGAGAGKSVLVLRLAYELLRRRTRGSQDPVPAVVSLASWDPGQGLLGWLAGQLAAEYPDACTPVAGAPPVDVAFHLLLTRRVLPVLDGFDELPEHRRADALRQITETMVGRRPFVLTSREPEYREHVPDEGVLERTEIRLSPLSDDTVRAYLSPGRTRTRWTPVLDRLGDRSADAPEVQRLRDALSVPLMVGLARVAYARGDSDPAELLKPGRFDDRRDIERHLYDAFLDVVYSGSHDVRAAHGGSPPERARVWAAFLAARMKEAGEQDLAWWKLDEMVPRVVRALALVPAFVVGALPVAQIEFGPPWWGTWLPLKGAFVLLCGLALTAAAMTGPAPWQHPPRRPTRPGGAEIRAVLGRRSVQVKAVLASLGLVAGWATVLATDVSVLPLLMVIVTVRVVWVYGTRVIGFVWHSSDPALADTPAGLLRADRRGVLTLGWLAPARQGVEETPLAVLVLPLAMLMAWQMFAGSDVVSARDWLLLAIGLPFAWVLYSFGASAWGGFTVARLYFWATGRLPRQLMAFLEDAHARGVLRQSGGVYRFRHIELRDRLAQGAGGGADTSRRSRGFGAPGGVPATLLAMATMLALLAVASGALIAGSLPAPFRSLPAACGLLAQQDLDRLMMDPAKLADADGQKCSVGEQAPFSRNIRISVHTQLETGKGRFNTGATKAHLAYTRAHAAAKGWATAAARRSIHHELTGFGDEAYLAALPYSAVGDEISSSSGYSQVGIRVGNAVLYVEYQEEFASLDRVGEVAQILAREAAHRAGLADGDVEDGGAGSAGKEDGAGSTPISDRSLVNLPPPAGTPTKDNRFAYYSRRPAQLVYGATWAGDERSYLWNLWRFPLVFRAPKHLDCERKEVDDPVTYTCKSRRANVKAGFLPDLRLEFRSHYCGSSCSNQETDAFLRGIPDHAQTSWTKADDSTYYATDRSGEPGRYRMAMKRHWGWQDKSAHAQHAYLLWVRVDITEEHDDTAQKIVNDMFTQTGGFREVKSD
ncbi:NACHT domain-containing protein [Streptomyces sp. NPDC058092]|uniref:NACHT domain-containing protein n=1 Tax=Streptomyces sp. NPDC058092 TaxID=3346336 RepID=UPI0036F0DEDA